MLSTQVARPLVEVFFGRLDARTATCGETADLMQRYFPGGYELVEPGRRSLEGAWPGREPAGERPLRIAYCLEEERGALRLFMRALRRLPAELDWEAAVWLPDGGDVRMSKRLRERVHVVGPRADGAGGAGRRQLTSSASRPAGREWRPGLIRAALGSGTVPVVSQLPLYDELVGWRASWA